MVLGRLLLEETRCVLATYVEEIGCRDQGAMFVMAAAICLQLRSENLICVEERAHSFCVRAKIDMRSETSSLPSSEADGDEEDSPQEFQSGFDSIST